MTDAGTVFIAIAAIVIGGVGFGILLLRVGGLRHPAPLITSLSMLTAIAVVGGIVTESSDALTLAGTGLGALAGALAAVYHDGGGSSGRRKDDQ